MRIVLKTAILASACVAAMPAAAQVTPGPVYYNQSRIPAPGFQQPRVSHNPPYRNAPRMTPRHNSQRWGGTVNGRWHGGSQAPGGWGAYRRPSRGYQLDRYWMSPNFQIPDYHAYGLGAPPNGYFWVRYYDDAVMVDSYGRVRDSVSGIAWAEASAEASAGYASASSAASAGAGYGGRRGGPIATVDPNGAYYEDDYGYGDQGHGDDIRYSQPQGGYAPPVVMGPPAVQMRHSACPHQCPPQVHSYGNQGYSGGGYYQGGGYYGGGATTTVVIQYPATVTTTTTTEEVIEESSSYETTYVSRPRTKLVRRGAPRPHYTGKRLRRTGCGC